MRKAYCGSLATLARFALQTTHSALRALWSCRAPRSSDNPSCQKVSIFLTYSGDFRGFAGRSRARTELTVCRSCDRDFVRMSALCLRILKKIKGTPLNFFLNLAAFWPLQLGW